MSRLETGSVHIGVDFDNTIASYDSLFAVLAVQEGILPPMPPADKRIVRTMVRESAGGEGAWQRLQALAYGPCMADAELMPNVDGFFRACRESGIRVSIVSHKTPRPADRTIDADLRKSAWRWMESQGFFDVDGFGLAPDRVCFEDTRADKIKRISTIGCTHFIDDLVELFREARFPVGVRRCLYAPGEDEPLQGPFDVYRSWNEITHELLGVH